MHLARPYPRAQITQRNTRQTAGKRRRGRFNQELQPDIARARTYSAAQSDLAHSLIHRSEHQASRNDTADQQGDTRHQG